MSSNINQVILLGHTGKDPEVKQTKDGICVASFSLATSQKVKEQMYTQWHNCVSFGKLAEIIANYVNKGDKLLVQGSIKYEEYEKEGQKRYITKIVVSDITLLGTPDKKEPKQQKGPNAHDDWGDNSFHDDQVPF